MLQSMFRRFAKRCLPCCKRETSSPPEGFDLIARASMAYNTVILHLDYSRGLDVERDRVCFIGGSIQDGEQDARRRD